MDSIDKTGRGETPGPRSYRDRPGQNGLPLGFPGGPTEAQADDGAEDRGPDATPAGSDPFDLAALRISQDFAATAGVRKLLNTVPVKKPSKEWFVRTHPDSEFWLTTAVVELKEDREVYLVAPGLRSELADEPTFSPRLLVASVNRQGALFLWPIRLPGPDGRADDWSRSALEAAQEARSRWVRVTANMSLGAYDVAVAPNVQTEPEWPDLAFRDMIKIAFRDRLIDSLSHPVVQRLRGEA
ncbi:MAG: hypothetical protein U0800_06420 [Isosphaeraceae bacterium]